MPHRRGPWSPGEDNYLLRLVHSQGAHNWVRISHLIGSRSPKQCRERYHQNLKPSLNHDPISPEEGMLIERLVGEMGKRWAEIARQLHGRSDNAVKNWWNGGMNRRRRLVGRRAEANQQDTFDERAEPLSFARPALSMNVPNERNVRTTIISAPLRRSMDTPLPSPSVASEVSNAPSLISDNGSNFSMNSPGLPISPTVGLPPLIGSRSETRRPSLPVLHLGSSHFVTDSSQHQYPPLANPVRKVYSESTPHAVQRIPGLVAHEQVPRDYHYLRQSSAAPLSSLQHQRPLPSYLTVTAPSPERLSSQDKDTRMSLSALCG